MDFILRTLDDVQEILYDLEDFLESHRDNEVLEFLSDHWKECLLGGLIAGVALYHGHNLTIKQRNQLKIDAKRAKFAEKKRLLKKQLVDNALGEAMTLERETILALEIEELLFKLKSNELDPLAVLEAYQARALEATEATNCVVDFILEARTQALELRKVPLQYRGPLHGLPISVKECHFVKGCDATAGLARQINSPAQDDGAMVKAMRKLGAVPFCLTNVPQTMNTYACSNPVFGLTTHPLDTSRTPGGSSGGEACLIAMGGSILGLGSDVGGSLRIPAHFCGISALKPTTGRLFERGRRRGIKGRVVGVQSNAGFMARRVEGVRVAMQACLKEVEVMNSIDYKMVPVPWNERLFVPQKKRLKIGYYTDDGYFPLTPACKRAVEVAIEALDNAGCEVVYFRPPHLENMMDFFFDHILADGGANSLEMWKGEILDQAIEVNNLVYKTPMWMKRLILTPIFALTSNTMKGVATKGLLKTKDLWKSLDKVDDIIEEILTLWQQKGIDVIIAPGFVFPAPPVKHPARLVPAISYTAAYNVLDFPVGSVPITRVIPQDEAAMESYPKSEDFLFRLVHEGARANTVGLPLNVQVVGRPWQEELVLHVMKLLQDNVSFH